MRISSRLDGAASLDVDLSLASLQEGSTYDPQAPPPPFGRAVRKYWGFESDYVNVNHGQSPVFRDLLISSYVHARIDSKRRVR